MDIFESVKKVYQKTLFLATNAVDIVPLAKLGLVNYSVVLNSDEVEKSYFSGAHFCGKGINNEIVSISSLPRMTEAKSYVGDNFHNFDYVWLFRPYSWSDDFSLQGKNVLSNSYYKYLSVSRKLHQDQQLYKHGDTSLRNHLSMKENYLSREIILTRENMTKVPGERIIFSSSSTGCSGVRTDYSEVVTNKNLFIKSDRLVQRSIPMCQNAVIIDGKVVKYQPKISIIDLHANQLTYRGGDYAFIPMYFDKALLEKMSRITHSVSRAIAKMGFKGVVNCDYIYNPDDGVLIFVEVNPRYSACTFLLDSYFSNAERDEKLKCLMPSVLHAASFMESRRVVEFDSISEYFEKDQYVEMNFLESDTKSFLKNYPSSFVGNSSTAKFRDSIISSPEFPVTLKSDLKEMT